MSDYYAGTWEEVVRFVKQTLSIGFGELDILHPEEVEKFMSDTDEEINSLLSQIYYVPLKKVYNGKEWVYPDPIPHVAKVLTAVNLVQVYYKDVNLSENSALRALKEEAYFKLNALVNDISSGSRRLRGQKLKARIRFASPSVIPSKPPTATSGPSGGIGVG